MEFSPHLIEAIRKARSCLVLTGAGVSAESGLQTFRGMQGLWDDFDPMKLATPEAFACEPKKVWEWYQWRREKLPLVQPNPAHKAIAEMERYFDDFLLVTQNIDGLHQRAGSMKVVELHGNLNRNKCSRCSIMIDVLPDSDEIPPRCACGGRIRPDVIWFGEMLPEMVLRQAWRAAESSELFFSIGTSSVVQPAASLGLVAKNNGAALIEVNLERTELSPLFDQVFLGPAGEIMPRILDGIIRAKAPGDG
ncbi:MAG: NAD-dependent deacylase [Candidatus Edwardsbacteria bacterium]|nr:NAD-dependent deacylase [Candidatus Edwardsbacteria bacterium]